MNSGQFKVVKKLSGFSGSEVYLMTNSDGHFIRKIKNVDRNYERMNHLYNKNYPVPKVYYKMGNTLDQQYIAGLDMKTYLETNGTEQLTHFLIDTLTKFGRNNIDFDYTKVYNRKLDEVDFSLLPFDKEMLIEKLPKLLPRSFDYHGDMTLENILHGNNDKFYMIDPMESDYDSYVFDIAKMRQDLTCKWFLRNTKSMIDVKLRNIEEKLLSSFPRANDDNLLILMLLRVYRYAKVDSPEHIFILKEINKLWK